MRWEKELAAGAAGKAQPASFPAFSMVMRTCYPRLLDDLNLLRGLLRSLHVQLTAAPETTLRHHQALQSLLSAMHSIDDVRSASPTRKQLERLFRSILQQLHAVEDDVSSSSETIQRHALALQNIDLASQLLSAIIVETVTSELHPLTMARLQNLRSCCKEVLKS